ncbi:SGNH/GDSL hydrolase family protein [Microbacterium sp. NPDC090007]|uniref:SGNH/GDSL hydrolase family protein n=1 Tax=Microbacterium sp. NPDC090007 TaxID=3364204 RepID=UPI0037FD69D5
MRFGRRGRAVAAAVAALGLLGALSDCSGIPQDGPTAAFAAPLVPPTSSPASSAVSRVVTLGDSVMSGYNLPPEQAWPVLLGARARVAVTNLACPGMGFVVPGDCGTSFEGFVPAVAALQPQVLLVESSSNDFWEDGDEIRDDTADTVDELHAAAPDALIVGLSTIWNDDPDVPDDTAVTSDALRDAVQAVGGTFVDVGQPLAGHPEWMQEDGVHPTARGQRAIEQTVMSALQRAGVLP